MADPRDVMTPVDWLKVHSLAPSASLPRQPTQLAAILIAGEIVPATGKVPAVGIASLRSVRMVSLIYFRRAYGSFPVITMQGVRILVNFQEGVRFQRGFVRTPRTPPGYGHGYETDSDL